ncbi:MAG: hypothetical protein KIG18_01070 [Candidatus Methanomethylophilaceae archaeon]|nr:hypothetical protein [Candidatus Methanomethylophilaceae archaeon]
MQLERYDDMEPEKERRRRKRSTDIKVATVMILLFFIGLILLVIWSDGKPISPPNEEKGVKDASEEKNGEITHLTENNATTGQESQSETNEEFFLKDKDGGYWVIEAFPVPEEWRR